MVARFVRDEEAAGSNPVIPTTLNLSNKAVSEVFALFKILQKIDFDHNFLSSTVGQSPFLCLVLYKHSPKLLYCSLASYAYFCYNEEVMD